MSRGLVEEIVLPVWGEVGTCSRHIVEQALLWHQDGNDLMFYVVCKGLKRLHGFITIGREKTCLFGSVIRSMFLSGLVWWSWCQVDRLLSLGSTIVSSPGKSLFHLRVPFLVITDFLPLSFLARGNFHYRNLSLPMSISELRHLNQNVSIVGFQNSQSWFGEILITVPKVNLSRYL